MGLTAYVPGAAVTMAGMAFTFVDLTVPSVFPLACVFIHKVGIKAPFPSVMEESEIILRD